MHTRKALLATAVILPCLVPAAAPAAEDVHSYVTQPNLQPPVMIVNTSQRGQTPGYIFVTNFVNKFTGKPIVGQPGPMILDNQGRVVWFKPYDKTVDVVNLQAQTYKGKPVLTWWTGTIGLSPPSFDGIFNIANDRYRTIAQIKPTNGWKFALHEIFITKRGTALVSGSRDMQADLRPIGGAENGTLTDSGVLEYDIATGTLLREWTAFAHVPLEQSQVRTTPENTAPVDAYRVNSVDEDTAGNWLISMRNAWAIVKVNGQTGDIIWRLGGKASDFALGENAQFAFQHDARFRPNGEISLFDNDCCALIPQPSGPPQAAPPAFGHASRGLILRVDETAKTAARTVERTLPYTPAVVAGTQGNMQVFPSGNALIGWGQQPFISEHGPDGKLLLSIRFPDPNESYRAWKFEWTGRPTDRPRGAARADGSRTRVFASWNGATEVAAWRVLGGERRGKLDVLKARVPRTGFETSVKLRSVGPFFRVQALSAKGRVLGTSSAFRRTNTQGSEPAPVY